ncbi:4909_t:CDS:2 [Ambispora gerdemannii]|uniref:4909_t:CDS:1 n=1 Tax=Ambispora gerdemannii TaxID=144530 RepID=A0A9N9AZ58_9GLOM|nr:4909_t:CDS:2 [Ambispora gerdemannii]
MGGFSIQELSETPEQCIIEHKDIDVAIGVFIACGLLVSYLPQHYRIIRIKSSEGLSPWFLLLGTLSGTSSLYNMIILQYRIVECCAYVSSGECFKNTLGVFQIGLQWLMFTIVYPFWLFIDDAVDFIVFDPKMFNLYRFILFLAYFPEHRKLTPYIPHLHYGNPPSTRSLEWRISLGVAITVTTHFLFVSAISIYLLNFYNGSSQAAEYWADFLGVASMLLASVQYLPQIWRTWRRKTVGALSIPMMLMQTPGSFLFVYSLAVRPGTNWTSWIVFLVTGCLQGILLVMCIVWHFRAKRLGYGPFYVGDTESLLGRDGQPISTSSPTERTGLLRPPTTRTPSYVKKGDDEQLVT